MLRIAVATEFTLAEKIIDLFEKTQFADKVEALSAVELYPFREDQGLRFNNKAIPQIALDEVDWSEFDYVFFAGDVSKAPTMIQATDAGAIVLDLLGLCANLPDVPVIVPGVNDDQIIEMRQRNIVALPHLQVTQAVLALAPLMQETMLNQLVVTTLSPASAVNEEAVGELAGQTARLLNGIPLEDNQKRVAFDVYPAQNQTLMVQLQKIFPQLDNVIFHTIQVPVFYGMGQMITALSDYEIDPNELVNQWASNAFITYSEDKVLTPVTNGEQEMDAMPALHISALTPLMNGVEFWTVADDQRFNLALMAIQLAEVAMQA